MLWIMYMYCDSQLNSQLNSSLLKTGSRKAKRDTVNGEQTDE